MIGDIYEAKDKSCIFIIVKETRVGYEGRLIKSDNTETTGSVTYLQLENDFIKISKVYTEKDIREFIKKDRESVAKHAITKDITEPACQDHTPYWGACISYGRYDNPDIIVGSEVDKNSIINAPEITLL